MKDFFKNNWSKVVVLLILMIIVLAFLLVKRSQDINLRIEQDKITTEMQIRCQNFADKRKTELEKEDYISNFNFKYNKSTQRCILSYMTDSKPPIINIMGYYIEDVFSGENLYKEVIFERGEKATQAYNALKERSEFYFNQP